MVTRTLLPLLRTPNTYITSSARCASNAGRVVAMVPNGIAPYGTGTHMPFGVSTTIAWAMKIAVGHSLDTLNYVLGEFAELSALSDLRRPLVKIEETGEEVVKTAGDQIAVIGTLTSGATVSVHVREAVAGGTGFLWEINGTDGTLRITADVPFPGIFPLTVAGAQGRNEPAELAVPAAVTEKWPALSGLEGTPAFNVGRTYAAFAADIDNGKHSAPDFADAVRRHETIAAIDKSAASGERVKVYATG